RIFETYHVTSVDSMASSSSVDSILFFLNRGTDRISSRLRARGLRARKLELVLHLDRNKIGLKGEKRFQFSFPRPQASSFGLLYAVKERLHSEFFKAPLEAGVEKITLEVLECSPSSRVQKNFFSQSEEELEDWSHFVQRLVLNLGESNVFFADLSSSHIPE